MSDDDNRGLTPPLHTQVPNEVLDQMADLTECELRVILFAIRKIIGWHKTRDEISLTSFQQGTGLSRQGVIDGVEALIARGWLMLSDKVGKRGAKYYELRFKNVSNELTSQTSRLVNVVDQSNELTRTSQRSRPLEATTSQRSRLTKEIVLKEKKDKPLDPMFEAIAKVWKTRAGAFVGHIRSMVLGVARKGEWQEANFDTPAIPDEILLFGRWWTKHHPDLSMPRKPEKIQSYFYEFRASRQRYQAAQAATSNGDKIEHMPADADEYTRELLKNMGRAS